MIFLIILHHCDSFQWLRHFSMPFYEINGVNAIMGLCVSKIFKYYIHAYIRTI